MYGIQTDAWYCIVDASRCQKSQDFEGYLSGLVFFTMTMKTVREERTGVKLEFSHCFTHIFISQKCLKQKPAWKHSKGTKKETWTVLWNMDCKPTRVPLDITTWIFKDASESFCYYLWVLDWMLHSDYIYFVCWMASNSMNLMYCT